MRLAVRPRKTIDSNSSDDVKARREHSAPSSMKSGAYVRPRGRSSYAAHLRSSLLDGAASQFGPAQFQLRDRGCSVQDARFRVSSQPPERSQQPSISVRITGVRGRMGDTGLPEDAAQTRLDIYVQASRARCRQKCATPDVRRFHRIYL